MSRVVKLRGLPWEASPEDIKDFLGDVEVSTIRMVYNSNQKPTGEAFVVVPSKGDLDAAIRKHRQGMGRRYVEVFPSTEAEAARAAHHKGGGSRKAADHGDGLTLKMRGLPFDSSEADIAEWFRRMDVQPRVIHLGYNSNQRPSGEAYVQFATVEDATAAKKLHMQSMGARYIELFNSSEKDMMNAVRRRGGTGGVAAAHAAAAHAAAHAAHAAQAAQAAHMAVTRAVAVEASGKGGVGDGADGDGDDGVAVDGAAGEETRAGEEARAGAGAAAGGQHGPVGAAPLVGSMESMPDYFGAAAYSPLFMGGVVGGGLESMGGLGHMGSGPAGSDDSTVLRMRGLPFSATERDVMQWVWQSVAEPAQVHLVMTPQNRPSGEAFLEFASAADATAAMKMHLRNMGSRYIELFPSSFREMNQVLGGGQVYSMPPAAHSTMFMHYGVPNLHMWGTMPGANPMEGYGTDALWQPAANGHMAPSLYGSPMGGLAHPAHSAPFGVPSGESMGAPPTEQSLGVQGGSDAQPQAAPQRREPSVATLRLRGLPYRATLDDVADFFEGYAIIRDRIRMGRDREGRSSGECWVDFSSAEEAQRAQRERNKKHIGDRYVEIFPA